MLWWQNRAGSIGVLQLYLEGTGETDPKEAETWNSKERLLYCVLGQGRLALGYKTK